MTPIVLVVLVGMWAAVLLPPYLRDRRDTKAARPRSPLGDRVDAIARSVRGRKGAGYLPVSTSSSQGAPQSTNGPLPAGARHPITHRGAPVAVPDQPQSPAFQVLGRAAPAASAGEADGGVDPRYLLAPDEEIGAEPAPAVHPEIPREVLAARAARKRRREVFYTLLAASGLSLLMAVGLGGPVILLHLLIDVLLVAYVVLLIQRQKLRAEREIKVAFLPHGGEGVSAPELLAEGGGFRAGHVDLAPVEVESTAFRVVRSQAN